MKQWLDEQGRRVTQFEPDDDARMEALIAELGGWDNLFRSQPSDDAVEWAKREAKRLGLDRKV